MILYSHLWVVILNGYNFNFLMALICMIINFNLLGTQRMRNRIWAIAGNHTLLVFLCVNTCILRSERGSGNTVLLSLAKNTKHYCAWQKGFLPCSITRKLPRLLCNNFGHKVWFNVNSRSAIQSMQNRWLLNKI